MENKQPAAESEGSSICSDVDKLNLADFAIDEFEAKSNDGNAGEIEKIKVELVEMKKEMEAMKLANKLDSDEIANKLEGKIDQLEKYVNDQFQKLAQENQKQSEKYIRDDHLKMIVEKLKEAAQQYGFGPLELPKEEGWQQSKQNESVLMDMAKQREIVQDVQNLQSIQPYEMSEIMNQEERDMLSRSQHPWYRKAYIRGRQLISEILYGLGGEKRPINWEEIQKKYKQIYGMELTGQELKRMFQCDNAFSIIRALFQKEVKIYEFEGNSTAGHFFLEFKMPNQELVHYYEEQLRKHSEFEAREFYNTNFPTVGHKDAHPIGSIPFRNPVINPFPEDNYPNGLMQPQGKPVHDYLLEQIQKSSTSAATVGTSNGAIQFPTTADESDYFPVQRKENKSIEEQLAIHMPAQYGEVNFETFIEELTFTLASKYTGYTDLNELRNDLGNYAGFSPELVAQQFGFPNFACMMNSDLMLNYVQIVPIEGKLTYLPRDFSRFSHIRGAQEITENLTMLPMDQEKRDKFFRRSQFPKYRDGVTSQNQTDGRRKIRVVPNDMTDSEEEMDENDAASVAIAPAEGIRPMVPASQENALPAFNLPSNNPIQNQQFDFSNFTCTTQSADRMRNNIQIVPFEGTSCYLPKDSQIRDAQFQANSVIKLFPEDSNPIGPMQPQKKSTILDCLLEKLEQKRPAVAGTSNGSILFLPTFDESGSWLTQQKENKSLEEKLAKLEEIKKSIIAMLAMEEKLAKLEEIKKGIIAMLAMEEKLAKFEEEIGRNERKLAAKDEEIWALELENGGLKKEIGQKDQKMKSKDAMINESEGTTAYLNKIIWEKQTKMDALENEIAELKKKKAFEQQSNTIAELKKEGI